MLTYSFDLIGTDSLYEYLYKQIKNDIRNRTLKQNEKLPSVRAFAKHLNISTITVENAYAQLNAEGYIYSIPKSGFYVSDVSIFDDKILLHNKNEFVQSKKVKSEDKPYYFMDFVNNATDTHNFPFDTWAKLMRETISDNRKKLLVKSPSTGIYELRSAIVKHLYEFRGLLVEPEQIVIGAGTEYLYGLLIQLLGHDKIYAVEDPGYQMIHRIYRANNVQSIHLPLDEGGIDVTALYQSQAEVLHITPSHHFPTGIVTPAKQRYELLAWATKSKDRYIIEDDYDSEFRLKGRPIQALQSIDVSEKVIYMNTFSKSLSSTIRISYMVLPKSLLHRYNNELSFYACTVSNFEQYTLAKYIERGYFERHINRMRNYYRNIRDAILMNLKNSVDETKFSIMEEHAGLHFLIQVNTSLTDRELIDRAAKNGIHVSCLSQYYHNQDKAMNHILVINYSGINVVDIPEAVKRLFDSFLEK